MIFARPVIATLDPPLGAIADELAERYSLVAIDDDPASIELHAANARGLLTSGSKGASAELIEALPLLEIIAVNGVGYDKIDRAAARARGIILTNTPDLLTDDVADLAIGLILSVSRRIGANHQLVRDGEWRKAMFIPLGRSLGNLRLGIVGLGCIGKAIARRAETMMASIAYTGPREQPDLPYSYFADALSLAAAVDVLVLAVPLNRTTYGMVDQHVIEALGADAILINVARGAVVDEPALVAALADGRLGGAGLDVFVDEPHVPATLLTLDNVVLQPHRGSATIETRLAMGRLVIANLDAHFSGRPPPTPVT